MWPWGAWFFEQPTEPQWVREPEVPDRWWGIGIDQQSFCQCIVYYAVQKVEHSEAHISIVADSTGLSAIQTQGTPSWVPPSEISVTCQTDDSVTCTKAAWMCLPVYMYRYINIRAWVVVHSSDTSIALTRLCCRKPFSFLYLCPPPITALLLFQVCLPLFRCLSIVTILLAPSICSQKQKSKILIDAALQVGPTLQEIKSWFELAVASGKHSADQMEEWQTHTTIPLCVFICLRVFCAVYFCQIAQPGCASEIHESFPSVGSTMCNVYVAQGTASLFWHKLLQPQILRIAPVKDYKQTCTWVVTSWACTIRKPLRSSRIKEVVLLAHHKHSVALTYTKSEKKR